MILDFTDCKTVEDANKKWLEYAKDIPPYKQLLEKLNNHSPHVPKELKELLQGDTRKGCGKWFDTPNSQTQSEEKCGEHELCPACSGDGE